jgi:hypothetical protein
MEYLFQDVGKPKKVGRSKSKASKNDKKKKTTKSKSDTKSRKGGNFLGSVGELAAPSGWKSFTSPAALLATNREDASLRRGSDEKKKMSGGHGKTRKHIFNKNMDRLNISYSDYYQAWKLQDKTVIDCKKYYERYMGMYENHKYHTFPYCKNPPLAIVIDSLSKFFKIEIRKKNGDLFIGDLFHTGKKELEEIYDKMYEDIESKKGMSSLSNNRSAHHPALSPNHLALSQNHPALSPNHPALSPNHLASIQILKNKMRLTSPAWFPDLFPKKNNNQPAMILQKNVESK